ncbi:MAG: hypothetical protein ACM31C_15625 [Acidobacteriota bacterium]
MSEREIVLRLRVPQSPPRRWLAAIAAGVLGISGLVAASVEHFSAGETLSATKTNSVLDYLDTTINGVAVSANPTAAGQALVFDGTQYTPAAVLPAGGTIVCKMTVHQAANAFIFSHTFSAAECGGATPDTSKLAIPISWTDTCNGIGQLTAFQGADTGFPGVYVYWDGGGCTSGADVSVTVAYLAR